MTYHEKSIDYAYNTVCKNCMSYVCSNKDDSILHCKRARTLYQAHLAGIMYVQDEIYKMRNCDNCKYGTPNGCKLASKNYWCNRDKWELKE